MPSKDLNGKRLPGNQQRSLARIRRGDPPPQQPAPTEPEELTCSPLFLTLSEPPICVGVEAVSSWFSSTLALVVDVLSGGIDPKGVLISKSIKASIKLHKRATESEMALRLRQFRLAVPYDLGCASRPTDEIATHAWAYCRLAKVVHDIALCEDLDRTRAAHFTFLISALATFERVDSTAAALELKEAIEAKIGAG